MPTKTLQSEIQKIPKLRFVGFIGAWEERNLGKNSKFFSGGTPSTANRKYYLGKIPFIKSGEISEDKTEQFVSEEALENSSAKKVNKGDLLYALYGATSGAVAISRIDGAINQAVLCIRTEENKNWLFNYLDYNKGRILTRYLQGGQGNLSADIVRKLKIYFPTYSEQQKIAKFLGGVDEWIENLRAQKESFESYKKGMMQKIFSQEIRFKDAAGKEFPGWKEKKLGEVFYSEKGDGIPKDAVVADGTNECILYGELYTTYKEVIFNISSKTDSDDGLKSQVGDLLIPCSTTTTGIDLANITALNKKGVLLGGDITVLRSKDEIDSIFYAYYLSNYKKKGIAKYAQGSTIVHLYYSHFKNMSIDMPTYEEQQKIAEFLGSIDKVLESKQQQITQAEQWKKGLMQGLFV